MISKIIVQTSKEHNQKNKEMIMQHFPNWEYHHFNDEECVEYILKNKIEDFPNAIDRYERFETPQHRADFFRYYFLYINGGGFLDSDFMLYKNIEEILEGYSFVSCDGYPFHPQSLYQGFLFAEKNNEIIYHALKNMYLAEEDYIKYLNSKEGYLEITYDIYRIYEKLKNKINCNIVQETNWIEYLSPESGITYGAIKIGFPDNWFGIHWQQEKVIRDFSLL